MVRQQRRRFPYTHKSGGKHDGWAHPLLLGNSSRENWYRQKLFCPDESRPACQIFLGAGMPPPGEVFPRSYFLCPFPVVCPLRNSCWNLTVIVAVWDRAFERWLGSSKGRMSFSGDWVATRECRVQRVVSLAFHLRAGLCSSTYLPGHGQEEAPTRGCALRLPGFQNLGSLPQIPSCINYSISGIQVQQHKMGSDNSQTPLLFFTWL